MARKKSQNETGWTWTVPRERAAQLLADDELTDEEISQEARISRHTLWVWKQNPEFSKRIEDLVKVVQRRAIARRARRVRTLEDRWRAMQRVIVERAADPAMQNVPGGTTGLLVRYYKGLGSGDNFQVVEEYRVDTALLKELREHEKQAAQELGQWAEKHELTGAEGKPLIITLIEIGSSERHDRPALDHDAAESDPGRADGEAARQLPPGPETCLE